MFDNLPAAPKVGLFGEVKKVDPQLASIEAFRSKYNIRTTANRINFILNGVDASKMQPTQISGVGEFHISEAAEANKCVDAVVSEFEVLQTELAAPKQLILEALASVEGKDSPKGFLSFLRSSKPDPAQVRATVKAKTDDALVTYKAVSQAYLEPFLEGLEVARNTLFKLSEDLDNTINAMNYVVEMNPDPMVQDLARRRKEMFSKSFTLMEMNKTQVENMFRICSQCKNHITELELNVIPIVQAVLRTNIINGSDDQGAEQIREALKRMT